MGKIIITSCIPGTKALEIYLKISDFSKYSNFIDVIRDISVEVINDNSSISKWEVDFENGVLCWKEKDSFDRAALSINFEKFEGDIDKFIGNWSVRQEQNDSILTFEAEYDLGMSLLEDILDPIAGDILAHTIQEILKGLFSDVQFIDINIRTLALKEEI
ncbi:SRPBCC family protein [Lysinibacillus sp. NPDC095746]|uniref:SRPBCC family protein n=1 Tax=Lysinibacillus sp. NPDC095746 TaxID=3364134 RepID=UPI0037F2EDE7